nr:hypothetical protein CKG001_00940 [Bdellovibrio sp. CKG001]
MLSKWIYTAALMVFLADAAWAKKEILVLGGGGEPEGATTIFDETLKNLGTFSKSAGWKPTVVFNGGHKTTEALAKQAGGGKNIPATTDNLNKQIELFKQKIQKGELKKGDQLMISVATHGLEAAPPFETHAVSSKNGTFNMDRLKALRDLAEKKGVKLAIMDFSCHSGATLKLGTDKTCVISAASSNVGYNTTGSSIAGNLRAGGNLEYAFLGARSSPAGLSPGTPQISTEAGRKTYQATAFLSDSMRERSSLDTWAEKGKKAEACNLTNASYVKLARELKDIKESYGRLSGIRALAGLPDVDQAKAQLQQAIKTYESARNQALAAHRAQSKYDQEVCFELVPKMNYCGTMTQFDFGYEEVKKQAASNPSPAIKAELRAYEKFVKREDFKKWKAAAASYAKQADDLYWKAEKVGHAERKIYEALYAHYSKESKAPNPCRDFKL